MKGEGRCLWEFVFVLMCVFLFSFFGIRFSVAICAVFALMFVCVLFSFFGIRFSVAIRYVPYRIRAHVCVFSVCFRFSFFGGNTVCTVFALMFVCVLLRVSRLCLVLYVFEPSGRVSITVSHLYRIHT